MTIFKLFFYATGSILICLTNLAGDESQLYNLYFVSNIIEEIQIQVSIAKALSICCSPRSPDLQRRVAQHIIVVLYIYIYCVYVYHVGHFTRQLIYFFEYGHYVLVHYLRLGMSIVIKE